MLPERTAVDAFTEWARDAEPHLREALTALFGVDDGLEMTSEALTLAWERWSEVAVMENPRGYVWSRRSAPGRPLRR